MKALCQLKKWSLMTVLLCGISLAAYAIIPQVSIKCWTLTDITSRSAHLVVLHQGASSFQLKVYEGDQVVANVLRYPGATSPDEEIFSAMDIENLHPSTTYRLEIIVRSLPDENGQTNTDSRSIEFTTDPEP